MRSHIIRFEAIIFDLDGTLLDTLADLANSMNAALVRLGFPTHSIQAYRYFVGDGVRNEVIRVLPTSHRDEQTISKCIDIGTDIYARRWAENTKPYPGIPKMLSALQDRDIPMAILSNKPHDFTILNIEKLLPHWSFKVVKGAGPSTPIKPNPTGALQIADQFQIHPHRFLYLGDTNTDMQTADAAGMFALGALWGFRSADELLENGAKALAKTPHDVLNFFDNN